MIEMIAAELMGIGVPPILALYLATKFAAGEAVDFADLTGDIAIAQMAGGVGAGPSTYWRGDGSWAALPPTAFSALTGNIAVSQMAGGAGASPSTFWRGDNSWAALPLINFSELLGNIAVSQMAAGAGASSSTFWRGDGSWSAVNFSALLGNIAVGQMAGGTGAAATTFWAGDGAWKQPDSANIDFLGTGTGAVVRPMREKARDHFHLRDYGTPTGGDNSALINTAIAAVNAAGGGYLTMPPGTVPASAITLLGGVTLIGAGKGTASKIQNIGSAAYLIDASGTYGTPVALLADAAAGSDQVPVTTAGFTVGDAVVITDTYEYAPVDSVGYTSGETVYIKSIDSASLLTLRTKLYGSMYAGGSYTVANGASIRKCNFIESPRVADIEVYSDTALLTNAVHFQIARGAKAEDVFIRDFGNRGFVVRGSVDSAIENCGADNLRDNLAGGQAGYGVSVAGPCYGIRVSEGIWTRCRHAFTTQGGSTGYPHLITVSGNIVHDTTAVGIDSHNAGDDLHFEGNIISNINDTGLFIRAHNVTVKGGSITKTNGHGISGGETGLSNVTIDGVTIKTVNGHGVSVAQSCPSLTIKDTQITNAAGDGIQLFLSGTIDSTNLKVLRNIITGFGTVLTNRTGILTTGAVGSTGAEIAENTIDVGSGSAAYAIRTLLLTSSAVIRNRARGTFATATWDLNGNADIANTKIDAADAEQIKTKASTTARASLNIPHGAAPTTPVNGDMWTTTAGAFVQINGVTKTFTLT